MLHPYLANSRFPRILAHRGLTTPAMQEAGIVENSRAAIEAAIATGSEFVETDCHLTSDGEVVLFHDSDLLRVTGDPRKIADVTLAELTSIMAERGGVITLAAALAAYPTTRFNVDVKAKAAAEHVGRIVVPHIDHVLVTSFSDAHRKAAYRSGAFAAEVRQRPAASPGQWGVVRVLLAALTGIGSARAFAELDALQIPERQGLLSVLTPRLLHAAHRHGVEVHVWTVNDATRMRELVAMGVDGIVTDRADIAIAALWPES